MITPRDFLTALDVAGYRDLTGVPCSYFGGVYEALERDATARYVPACNEGTAFATAVGFQLGGRGCAVLSQNSGLGNLVNPLATLAMPYQIPILTFVTLRGWPVADAQEPQHEVMGRSSRDILSAIGVPTYLLEPDVGHLKETLAAVDRDRRDRRCSFVLVRSGVLGGRAGNGARADPHRADPHRADPHRAGRAAPGGFGRAEALTELASMLDGQLVVCTTGYLSRDLFAVADRPENFYMQGSMGHAGSIAAGVALSRPERRVVAIDGDGSLIMHLGALSTVGHVAPANLTHIVLDNGAYESTGGQSTSAGTTAFPDVAAACGYRAAASVDSARQLRAVRHLLDRPGPVLLHIRISAGGAAPAGRATGAIAPARLVDRFSAAGKG